ncbi:MULTISPECIES: peptide deformylase [Thermoanaerobacterium]|uniref:Peptide deformylase n=2 Tax=Thermoanaerobacterium TaxID=28895 RepID=W9EBD5_9THEO|nr:MULTISPECIES: peptide deformylase [Thermoanaerobacterium]AFK86725.1 Peptide deformylase [Thermoanaerobacterium saccharolyticum JW/SL-YS485]ETO38516.1 Peptide deformylase [Thermoanaerobacterium aotearoense SCUT27]
MALRYIRKIGDPILYKKAKYVDKIDDHVIMILDDMAETMYNADGVGLAANQIGILRRLVVVDVGDGLIELINPEIILEEGEQIGKEGCLSVPNVTGEVKRPKKVRVRYQDRTGEYKEIEGEDFLARALSHEIDHLNGILFVNKAIRIINDEEENMEAE